MRATNMEMELITAFNSWNGDDLSDIYDDLSSAVDPDNETLTKLAVNCFLANFGVVNRSGSKVYEMVVKASVEKNGAVLLAIDKNGDWAGSNVLENHWGIYVDSCLYADGTFFEDLHSLYRGTEEAKTWGCFWDDEPALNKFAALDPIVGTYKDDIICKDGRIAFTDETAALAISTLV